MKELLLGVLNKETQNVPHILLAEHSDYDISNLSMIVKKNLLKNTTKQKNPKIWERTEKIELAQFSTFEISLIYCEIEFLPNIWVFSHNRNCICVSFPPILRHHIW